MPRFFIVNAEQDGVATEQITHYEVFSKVEEGFDEDGARKWPRPLTINFYGGDTRLATAKGEYAERFLKYAAAHSATGLT